MKNKRHFFRLHVKAQTFFYLFPVVFIYFILIPYQNQILHSDAERERVIIEVYGISQKYILLFALWNIFLGFRVLLSRELLELSQGTNNRKKGAWGIYCYLMYVICILPYLIWLMNSTRGYELNGIVILFQGLIFIQILYFIMMVLKSSLAGLAVTMIYYYLSLNHMILNQLSVLQVGQLAKYYQKSWYVAMIVGGILLFFGGNFLQKRIMN